MTGRFNDFYTLLGLARNALPDEIRQAYLKAAKRLHPDRNSAPGETEMFLEIQKAYQTLSNPSRRASYDQSLSDQEPVPEPIKLSLQVSQRAIRPSAETQLVYLLLDLTPSEECIKLSQSAPLNLCLILDTSTSMKGEKLETVKATAIELVRKLKPEDIFSVVTFSDRAEIVIPATKQANFLKMENRIRQIITLGGTEIFNGLKTGLEEIEHYLDPKYVNHAILLTDGQTYGDEQACYELAENAARKGIGITGLGIGSEWNDIFLDKLANLTGGQSILINQPQEIEQFLNKKFSNLSTIIADNVTFEYELAKDVEINYAFRIQPETDPVFEENPYHFGPILQNWPLSVIIEFAVRNQENQAGTLDLIKGKLEIASKQNNIPFPAIPLTVSLQNDTAATYPSPPSAIVTALSKITQYRLQDKARKEVERGDFDQARSHLQKLATHLFVQGENNLAKTILLEIQNIEDNKMYSELGEKQIKYGTRALILTEEKKP